ncbi:MAG: hypothetical protein ABIA77_06335 [Candidatus Omnitrophota bacterium]
MTKNEALTVYGPPDMKRTVSSSEWNRDREEWVFRGRYTVLPVNAGHLSSDLYLYFDGENLTNISKQPLGKSPEAGAETGDIDDGIK